MRAAHLIALALPLAACAADTVPDTIDPAVYRTWSPILTHGDLPGHGGDTYRKIYASPDALRFEGGQYPEGTILVKEVYGSAPPKDTDLPQYVGVMRRVGPPTKGLDDDGGWLFTEAATPGGAETHYGYCWAACHVNAPFHGAWLDYSK